MTAVGTFAAQGPHPLRHRPFLLLMASRILSSVSFQGSTIAIGWLVYDRTSSAFDLGLIGLFQFLPMVLLTLPAGHVADRYDRKRVVVACQVAQTLLMTALAVGVATNSISVSAIFVIVALTGAARAFESPTASALLPRVAPQGRLPQAIALATSANQTATIIGPALGGLLYGLGASAPFIAMTLFFIAASASIAAVKASGGEAAREPPTLRSVFSGASFIFSRPVILGAVSLDLFAVLLGGITSLLPIFARDILHAGPWGLGLLRASPAVGALMMSLFLARVSVGRAVGVKMLGCVIFFGVATIVFSLSENVALSIAALFIMGAADNVSVVVRTSLVQLATPDEMRGRVSAVNSLFIGTSNQLGDFESGMVAALIGPVAAGVVGGVGTIVIALTWAKLFPDLRKADRLSG